MKSIWFLNCQQITELVSRSMDTELSLIESLGVKLHLMMCKLCSHNKNQFEKIRELAQLSPEPYETVALSALSQKSKNTLKKAIQSCSHSISG